MDAAVTDIKLDTQVQECVDFLHETILDQRTDVKATVDEAKEEVIKETSIMVGRIRLVLCRDAVKYHSLLNIGVLVLLRAQSDLRFQRLSSS